MESNCQYCEWLNKSRETKDQLPVGLAEYAAPADLCSFHWAEWLLSYEWDIAPIVKEWNKFFKATDKPEMIMFLEEEIKNEELWDAASDALDHLSRALDVKAEHVIKDHPDQIKEYYLHMETNATKALEILAEVINSSQPG